MMAGPPFLHENIHIDEEHDRHHHNGPTPLLPPSAIPDLRFEYSYSRSIQPYIQVERVSKGGSKDNSTVTLVESREEEFDSSIRKESEDGQNTLKKLSGQSKSNELPSEMIHIQWKKVAWVTVRDQVISPLLQGFIWAIVGYHLKPMFTRTGERIGNIVYKCLPSKEGLGITWLRSWAKNIGLTGGRNNYQTLKPSQ